MANYAEIHRVQYPVRTCPKCMSNFYCVLSSLTVERVIVFGVFVVRKGKNLFVSISVQKPSLEKGYVHVQVLSALFSWDI